ncbi:Transcription factor [Neofusicoccum parvum]|uniref:Transcription factor n=1 Tax=Neofusicoccum parvum TaxID=310453 RepID=A0ACB5SLF5_9PEZI|nr:Transcription factor [Neofusicoccum parvum]
MENSVESASPSLPTPATSRRRRIITSCDTCRRRKVKCDRQHPVCAPCQTAGRACLYKESSTRQRDSIDQTSLLPIRNHSHGVRRHPRNSPDLNTIDARLGRLERLLEQAMQTTRAQSDEPQAAANEGPNEGVLASPDVLPQSASPDNEIRAVNGDDGTLLVEDGKSHFVSSQHWALLATEVWHSICYQAQTSS